MDETTAVLEMPVVEAPSQIELKWEPAAVPGKWASSTWHAWTTEDGTYRVMRIAPSCQGDGGYGIYYGSCVKDSYGWQSIDMDPKMGRGYPKYWRSLEQALESVERSVLEKTGKAVVSNRAEVLANARDLALIDVPDEKIRKTHSKKMGYDNTMGSGEGSPNGVNGSNREGVQIMMLKEKRARKLLVDAGLKSAADCNVKRLQAKLNSLRDVKEDLTKPESEEDQTLLAECLTYLNGGGEIGVESEDGQMVTEGEVVEGDVATKGKPGRKPKDASGKTTVAPRPRQPKEGGKPGVIQTIRNTLSGVHKADALLKTEIVKILVKTFPDREAKSMESTLNTKLSDWKRDEQNMKDYKDIKVRTVEKDGEVRYFSVK